MGIIQAISDFLETLFNRNSPEVQKRIQMKKLDVELRSYQPSIYRDGCLLPTFAAAIRILYTSTKPIGDLLSATIAGSDIQKAMRFESQLVMTGFSIEFQKIVDSLSYEARKNELENTHLTISQIFDGQRRRLDRVLNAVNTDQFKKINANINTVRHLADFCKFSFITLLQVFDPHFNSADPSYAPSYRILPIEKAASLLEDLYFVMKGIVINTTSINALSALAQLRGMETAEKFTVSAIEDGLKRIVYILNHIITAERLKMLICYAKKDINYVPQAIEYNKSALETFSQLIQARFRSDEQRIKAEMKDEKITNELTELFGETPLLEVAGYSSELNEKLLANSAGAFMWIMPIRILKTFIAEYVTESVRILLNDIVIEGFFNNPTYKSDFSADVYAIHETAESIQAFEENFASEKKFSTAVIEGYLKDIHSDSSFMKKLEDMINEINLEANKLIAREASNINRVSKHINDLLQDAKKPSSEIIANLKVLMLSSRNKENSALLEEQYPKWQIFFEIMKNYAIIAP